MLMESSLLIPIEGVSYKTCGIIGVGGQGTVYLAKDEDDKTYAIKMIKDYNNAIVKQSVDAEIKIQKSFENCPYIIQYVGVQKQRKKVYIALELGQYTLKNCVDMRRMNQFDLIYMLCDVLQGLYNIHQKKMIHRDIKPQNIIYKEGVYKITDFGIAIEKEEDNSFVGTPLYLPPEILFEQEENYTNKIDIWSLGVSAFESYFKINPFYHEKQLKSYKYILEEVKKNIKLLTPQFSLDKFLNLIQKKGLQSEAEYFKKKRENTKTEVLENMCKFLEYDPNKREDSSLFLMTFISLKDTIQGHQIKKSRIHKNYQRSNIPPDLQIFCKAKDLFYELNSEIKYGSTKQATLGLQLGIWYLEGKIYGGQNIILLDEIKTIKDYNKKPTELWQDVKEYLSQYYWYLRTEKENEFFNKINELRLYILICSVWYELTFRDDGRRFCKVVSEITNLQILTVIDVFKFFSLYSEQSFHRIQTAIQEMYYYHDY